METRSTCPYCGVGCGVLIASDGVQITGVRGDPEHPANFGRLCSKGSTLHLTASAVVNRQTRLLQPMARATRGAALQPLDWDSALQRAVDGFARTIQTHGADAVGFYVSGQLLTEDYYVFNKLAKGLIGTNNIDTNSRLCMSSAVAGYKQSLGADAPPACYADLDDAHTLFISGSNTAYAHPILFRRIEDARRAHPTRKLIVCDPRSTDTTDMADLHLPLLPGTDVMLYNGMLHTMLWEGWIDNAYIAAHTSGFAALKNAVRDCTPERVAQTCGISKAALFEATRLFACAPATLSLYCQGLNQSTSGTANNTALINLHLASGQIGRAGAGPFSLTGQPNAMGGREVGGLANLLSAHRDLSNPAHRAEVASLWGIEDVPAQPGKTAIEMFQAAADGEIKALWIACTNPAHSLPDQATVRRALERAELVVLQEAFTGTATSAYADLLLPATTWGEKDGTVTNSERRISRVRAAVPASGAARHDWRIASDFALRLQQALDRPAPHFDYADAKAIWQEHRESTRERDLDITGMDYAALEATPLQWPMPTGAAQGRARLYEDGVFPTPDGRARFIANDYRPVAEPRDARYPFSLTTGRLRDQWHGMRRTGTVGYLFSQAPEPELQMHAQDLARRQLQDGDLVHVRSRRGAIVLPVRASDRVATGQLFMAMHWGEEFLSGHAANGERLAGVNALTTPAFCPDSKQPELKHTAVKVQKAELPWSVVAMAWLPETSVLQAQAALQALLCAFDYASCVPFGTPALSDAKDATKPQRDARHGLCLRAAAATPLPDAVLQGIEAILGMNDATNAVRYADSRRGQRRTLRLEQATAEPSADQFLTGFLLAGDSSASQWIAPLLLDSLPVQAYGRALLVPGAAPPLPTAPRSATVCTCFNVSASAIQGVLSGTSGSASERLAAVQTQTRCGTNCGSCIPQLQRMVRETAW